jgi:hypothetical protein
MRNLSGRLRRLERALAEPTICATCGASGAFSGVITVCATTAPGWRRWGGGAHRVLNTEQELDLLLQGGRCRGCGRYPKVYLGIDPDRL